LYNTKSLSISLLQRETISLLAVNLRWQLKGSSSFVKGGEEEDFGVEHSNPLPSRERGCEWLKAIWTA
jgi:hypothetical protein